jgi:peptidoglycan/xylan/chitin deacetylase (PgdA/CDA1 family)
MREVVRGLLATALDAGPLVRLLRPLRAGGAAIFVVHRFASPERGNGGIDPSAFRRHLAYLRRHRCRIASLDEVVAAVLEGRELDPPPVAFTVDDGYADFAEVGMPVFAEFDCPVTLFATTGFLDGQDWMWWDRIADAIQSTPGSRLEWQVDGRRQAVSLGPPAERLETARGLAEAIERAPDRDLRATVRAIVASSGIEQAVAPPSRFAPMTWDQARECERRGATIAPHTVTHPILANVEADVLQWEIEESWRRVRAETQRALDVFAYPNGSSWAFGRREAQVVERLGVRAAVSTSSGYVRSAARGNEQVPTRFSMPRFYASDDALHVMQVVTGLARLRGHG